MNTNRDTDRDNKYLRAKERMENIKKFYTSLFFYIVFILFLAGLNYYTNELRYPWFLWAAFGWGLGLIFQAAKAFDWNPFISKDWEERKIKEYMERDSKSQSNMGRWE